MSLYSIEDTTLTALGDAVRNKTGKYISVEEKGEPFFTATGSTADLEMVGYDSMENRNLYVVPIDFRAMPKADIATNWYVEYRFESCDVAGPMSIYIKFFNALNEDITNRNNQVSLCSTQKDTLIKSGNTTVSILDSYKIAYLKLGMNPNYDSQGQSIAYDVKIWACDNSKKFYKLNTYTPLEMADAINGLKTIPDEALSISGDGSYRFAFGGSDWLINRYGDKITTKNITTASYMFSGSTRLEGIPFVINMNNNAPIDYMFQNCNKLKNVPQVNVTRTSHTAYSYLFANCHNIRELPEWFIDLLEQDYNISSSNSVFAPWRNMLTNCYSLRKIPDRAMKAIVNPNPSSQYYTVLYSNPFAGCRSLDELINIYPDNYNFTSNQFSGWFDSLYRVKNITFATNEDGTPMVRKWKNQTINFASGWIGWVNGSPSNVTGYNSGITADKQVTDDATYQALKDDPDWFSCIAKYNRYNHDSAVNTINSLPDCSATGTNVIKFLSGVGEGTDGGAIGNLTEEEIAVASAKGWTVTLV